MIIWFIFLALMALILFAMFYPAYEDESDAQDLTPVDDESGGRRIVLLYSAKNLIEASMLQGYLESGGIEVKVVDNVMSSLYHPVPGIATRFFVSQDQLDQAKELLDEFMQTDDRPQH